ncbi:histidine kinase [Streptomyces sp. NPDC057438]|uniref:HAMP domain-containing sensor histidine kinase n=1 Tax=Streptomyces sp. NPDC057438 TaxID=3346133 RepID=UPI00368F7943
MSLFWRIFMLNAVVLLAALTLLLLGPLTVSAPVLLAEAAILGAGLAVMLIANAFLLRLGLAPLRRLAHSMATVDLLRPRPRPTASGYGEIAELVTAFNAMIGRLEAERAASSGRALSAQEAERHRIAQELHDEIGQSLTAVLLSLKHVADQSPEPLREQLHQAQETTRASLDEIRRVARRLRPGVLEELGLISALKSLAAEFTGPTITVRHHIDANLPALDHDTELVVYRVAQESLTNAARHSGARIVDLTLQQGPAGIELRVRDDGRGLDGLTEGAGIRGMRERALLIGADLALRPGPDGGTEIHLTIPMPHRSNRL